MTSSSLSQASVFIIIRLAMVGINGQQEIGVRRSPWFPRECSRGPGFYSLTSPFSLQTPTPSFPFSARWLQCSAVEASGLLGEPPAPSPFLQLNPYLRSSLWGLLEWEEEEEETDLRAFRSWRPFSNPELAGGCPAVPGVVTVRKQPVCPVMGWGGAA